MEKRKETRTEEERGDELRKDVKSQKKSIWKSYKLKSQNRKKK